MPFVSKTGLRSFTQKVVASTASIPDYAILLAVGDAFKNSTLLKNVFSIGFTSDYYRAIDNLITYKIDFKNNTVFNRANKFYLYCEDDGYSDWNDKLGTTTFANTNLNAPNYATYLDFGGGHNVTAIGSRTNIPLTFSTATGKTLTTGNAVVYETGGYNIISNVYVTQTLAHSGHTHYVPGNNIFSAIMIQNDLDTASISSNVVKTTLSSYLPQIWPPYDGYFRLQTNDKQQQPGVPNWFYDSFFRHSTPRTYGYSNIKVKPVLRDPGLKGGNTPQTKLPGGVLVFGNDLPSQYYLRPYYSSNGSITKFTSYTSTETVDGLTKPHNHLYYEPDWYETGDTVLVATGVPGYDNYTVYKPYKGAKLQFQATSSEVPNHSHSNIPISYKQKSTDQTPRTTTYNLQGGYQSNSGGHFHKVNYTVDFAIKSKRLKAWITKDDNTPLANGVILAYCKTAKVGSSGNSDQDSLPSYWHFCDGTNDTPDLRGYCVAANFTTSAHDEEIAGTGSLTLENIEVIKAGSHTHYTAASGVYIPPTINGGNHIGYPADIGGHHYETNIEHAHTHLVPYASNNINSFKVQINPLPQPATTFISTKIGSSYEFTPPTLNLAFIMYNENIP